MPHKQSFSNISAASVTARSSSPAAGQDFVRVYSERVYGIPPEQVVGSAGAVSYQYGAKGPVLIKEPKLLLNDDNAGKPENIHP